MRSRCEWPSMGSGSCQASGHFPRAQIRASPSPDSWVLATTDGRTQVAPKPLRTSAGQTWEGGQACVGTWVFCRALPG